jgi:formate dehydrogenase iron-sulfur subunit
MADDLIISPGPSGGKSYLCDTTKCIACRSCQVACKQWNELGVVQTENRGSYENPHDMGECCWTLIRFKETERPDGTLAWNFLRNSCRHCVAAPCKQASENPDSITVDAETGAVVFQEGTKDESYSKIRLACPFDIPRQGSDGQLYKCVMCSDRVHNGELPACVKACPTDALTFGDREEMLAAAEERLAAVQANGFPDAKILDRRDVRLLLLLADPASMYTLTTRS